MAANQPAIILDCRDDPLHLGWLVCESSEWQKRAVEWVVENGGYILYEDMAKAFGEHQASPAWIHYQSQVENVFLPKPVDDLSPLRKFKGVKRIRLLVGIKLDVKTLSELDSLESLVLIINTNSDRDGVERLKHRIGGQVELESIDIEKLLEQK